MSGEQTGVMYKQYSHL